MICTRIVRVLQPLRLPMLGLGVVATLAMAGCSAEVPDGDVVMFDNRYDPETIETPAGQPIVFVNGGRAQHNIIEDDGLFDSSDEGNQRPGETWSLTLDEPGTYSFYCSLHAARNSDGEWEGMVGSVTVTE